LRADPRDRPGFGSCSHPKAPLPRWFCRTLAQGFAKVALLELCGSGKSGNGKRPTSRIQGWVDRLLSLSHRLSHLSRNHHDARFAKSA